MKKYIAKTNISINVVLGSGANRHIAFDALTCGGSVFYTDDPELQRAIERHYKFGSLFRLSQETDGHGISKGQHPMRMRPQQRRALMAAKQNPTASSR